VCGRVGIPLVVAFSLLVARGGPVGAQFAGTRRRVGGEAVTLEECAQALGGY